MGYPNIKVELSQETLVIDSSNFKVKESLSNNINKFVKTDFNENTSKMIQFYKNTLLNHSNVLRNEISKTREAYNSMSEKSNTYTLSNYNSIWLNQQYLNSQRKLESLSKESKKLTRLSVKLLKFKEKYDDFIFKISA